ncbi:MAG TPA: hypothetical protein VJJ51_06155, partial [Candidatus Methanoperedens sp.]|nr:hypothetical protein [Candidatus Methanoperedens sp.]
MAATNFLESRLTRRSASGTAMSSRRSTAFSGYGIRAATRRQACRIWSEQKPGDIPLGQCINDQTLPTPYGPGCWQLFFDTEPAHDEVQSHLDAGDTRMQQTWYVNGMLWGTAGTAVRVGGELKSGIAWFAVSPRINGAGKVEGTVKKQGYL